MQTPPPGRSRALAEPGFRALLVHGAFHYAGQTLFAAAISWHVYERTGSALHLGGIGLVQFATAATTSLAGGAFADAHDRVKILLASQAVSLVTALALLAATRADAATLPLLYGAAVASTLGGAFGNPAGSAVLPNLVPREVFAHAVALSAGLRQAARMSGPVLLGLVAARAGIAGAYALQLGLMLGSIGALLFVRPRESPSRRPVSFASVREGVSYVQSRPVLVAAMTLDMVAVVFAGALAVLPIYAHDILRVGALGYGVLAASIEAGTVLMGLLLVALPPIRRAGRALLYAVGAFGLATIAFGLSTSYAISIAALVACGMADQVSMVARSLIIQLSTPDALRGRVSSVNMVFISASNQLGAAESGFLAAATSAPFSVIFGGVACLGALAVAALRVPELREWSTDDIDGSPTG